MQIAIIGCGNMGEGIAQRLSAFNQLYFYDHHIEKSNGLEQEGYGKACQDINEAIAQAEIVILAVKPQNLKQVAILIQKELDNQILVSLLAGTSIETLKRFFPSVSVVRMMPNLALICGQGVIGLTAEEKIREREEEHLTKVFEPLGKVCWLQEDKINALTALTGSGPAFFFSIVEAMVDAGIAMGFSYKEAHNLIYLMLQGSLSLLEKTGKHPKDLITQIASPQGTTMAGLKKLEEASIQSGIVNAFLEAYQRANQIALDSKI